ncbi:hypothetical protein ACFYUJ_39045 [Streptomyces sp. NPDC004520]|uniref:hypothetical protein n=1 Tax=Streptomyces sp. NPDC004520 TaxID=3364702 RepID=UPI0036A0C563
MHSFAQLTDPQIGPYPARWVGGVAHFPLYVVEHLSTVLATWDPDYHESIRTFGRIVVVVTPPLATGDGRGAVEFLRPTLHGYPILANAWPWTAVDAQTAYSHHVARSVSPAEPAAARRFSRDVAAHAASAIRTARTDKP